MARKRIRTIPVERTPEQMARLAKREAITKFALVCAAVVAVVIMGFTIAVKVASSKKHEVKEGYTVITDVPGVTFEVDKTYVDNATALGEIAKDSSLENTVTYSYKDDDFYMIFNLYNYIIVAKKGTTFNFDERDISSALNASSINGIWFTEYGKDPVLESGNGVYTISVQAEVVITNASYNDYTGTLTTLIGDNGEEWSLFAGYTEKGMETYQEAMDYIATTFDLVEVE